MKKLILFLFAFLSLALMAESDDFQDAVERVKKFYDELPTYERETDYLFNRGFIFLNSLEGWNNEHEAIIANSTEWESYLKCIEESYTSNHLDSIDFNLFDEENNAPATLCAFLYRGDYIPLDTLTAHLKEDKSISFSQLDLFAANIINKKVYSANVEFVWESSLFFSNVDDIISLDIDFSDLQGYTSIDLYSTQTICVSYDCVGEKSICFRLITDNDTLYSYSHIDVKALESEVQLKSANLSNISVSGINYLYEEGVDGKLDKPIIISEGFDILDSESKEDLKLKWEGRMATLISNGYDVFYVDYNSPGADLKDNADKIIELIKDINDEKEGNFEGIYIGESMGGIIGRIALKKMENEGYDHQIGLFIPYDSPFKGAYVPEGLQVVLRDLAIKSFSIPVYSAYGSIIGGLFGNEGASMSFIWSQYNSKAAKQMLVTHLDSRGLVVTDYYDEFQDYLDDLGYPEQCRNVAVVNGSDDGDEQTNAQPGSVIVDHTFISVFFNYYIKAWYTQATKEKIATTRIVELMPIPQANGHTQRYLGGVEFSSAPGSFMQQDYSIDLKLTDYSGNIEFTFVPTLSALDIDASIYQTGDFDYLDSSTGHTVDDLINDGLTPFDDVYIDGDNSGHVWRESFFDADSIPMRELMFNDLFLQNRDIDNNRDFESSNTIIVGNNVQPWGDEKSQVEGDFIINANCRTVLEAGQEIILQPGFIAKRGASFSAKIGATNPNVRNLKPYSFEQPVIVGSKYTKAGGKYLLEPYDGDCIATWEIIKPENCFYLEKDSINIPLCIKAGQYTLTATINKEGMISASSKVIVVQKEDESKFQEGENVSVFNAIEVFPNPGKDVVAIKIPQNLQGNIERIYFRNLAGKVLIPEIYPDSDRIEMSISNLAAGMYFVEIVALDGVKYSTKFIKN